MGDSTYNKVMDKKQNSASKYVKVSDKKPNVSSGGKKRATKNV